MARSSAADDLNQRSSEIPRLGYHPDNMLELASLANRTLDVLD